ncbi:MAG TPA: DNA-directed RNA polymerase subunit beta [bacterium]|nr:DNA-directed RNA polymerase subunit beta [bacterium]
MRKEPIKRKSFSKIQSAVEIPDLLDIQIRSFREFLQDDLPPVKRKPQGLQEVFLSLFPVTDSRENYLLEFVNYYVDSPKYSVEECRERGMTFAVPIKAQLRLSVRDPYSEKPAYTDTVEQMVYLGNFPYMTDRGTFIINGAERIIVNQLHRSPGVFFDEKIYPNGTKTFSARIIPFRGSWLEFVMDLNDVLYVYVDQGRKFPVTTLLRALGCSSDEEVLRLFDMIEEVDLASDQIKQYFGQPVFFSQEEPGVVDQTTGEVVLEKDGVFEKSLLPVLKQMGVSRLKFLKSDDRESGSVVINNTLRKDTVQSENDAIEAIYRQLRSGDPPDLDTARALIDRLFFNPKRYDLGKVGRYRMNRKLGLDVPDDVTVLTNDDFVAIIKYLLTLRSGSKTTDDIDHLGNRRVRTIGEQLAAQMSVGFSRMVRTVKERLNIGDSDRLTPQDLVNARTVMSVINTFFGTSQLSQFMDQTNPLAEMTHKRRLSALGPGGLTRERAGFEVRDVHYTHYGRLCPVETPEGPNIGLISSLATYARINEFGFLETPYRKVEGGRITTQIDYLTADEEEYLTIAQANAPLDTSGKFKNDRIKARYMGEFPVVKPEEVDHMDVSPNQIVSAAAALVPFLEHDDANRALMGSNMQRQAVPLLNPEAPLVGTGIEEKIARDSRAILVSELNGVVEKVTADRIVIRKEGRSQEEALFDFNASETVEYRLTKFLRTNQDTMINQTPLVSVGDRIKKGDVLADGCCTDRGELALGRNVLVAFIPWLGYNFEDAIVISERVVQEDVYTSIHVEEFDLQVRDTKRGEEELTREIPNVSEEATRNLDETGVIRIGAEVKAGDILVGKVTPKGETEPTPEEKLLKAIFGDKAGDVKDASLKAPPGMNGIVIDTKIFSLKRRDPKAKKRDKKMIEQIEAWGESESQRVRQLLFSRLKDVLRDEVSGGIRDQGTQKVVVKKGTKLTDTVLDKLDFETLDRSEPWVSDGKMNKKIERFFENHAQKQKQIGEVVKREKDKVVVGDELPPGIVQLVRVYIARKRKLQVGDKMAGRHGNKGVVARVVPVEDMPYLPDGTQVDIVLNPLGVPSRMNLGQILETNLGLAAKILGCTYATPVFDGASEVEVKQEMEKAGLPLDGKSELYDGRTGDKFDQRVTIGYIYIMKLSHLVEDKIHARSIGPYSLITQQPLGGKAQFGGQRFGEMEVWALEAYGAAHMLQEILTVKSDDVRGRAKTYEAIVKGENLPEPGVPESFNVLLKELMGLGLDVDLR